MQNSSSIQNLLQARNFLYSLHRANHNQHYVSRQRDGSFNTSNEKSENCKTKNIYEYATQCFQILKEASPLDPQAQIDLRLLHVELRHYKRRVSDSIHNRWGVWIARKILSLFGKTWIPVTMPEGFSGLINNTRQATQNKALAERERKYSASTHNRENTQPVQHQEQEHKSSGEKKPFDTEKFPLKSIPAPALVHLISFLSDKEFSLGFRHTCKAFKDFNFATHVRGQEALKIWNAMAYCRQNNRLSPEQILAIIDAAAPTMKRLDFERIFRSEMMSADTYKRIFSESAKFSELEHLSLLVPPSRPVVDRRTAQPLDVLVVPPDEMLQIMRNIPAACPKLRSLSLSNWRTLNPQNLIALLNSCKTLTHLEYELNSNESLTQELVNAINNSSLQTVDLTRLEFVSADLLPLVCQIQKVRALSLSAHAWLFTPESFAALKKLDQLQDLRIRHGYATYEQTASLFMNVPSVRKVTMTVVRDVQITRAFRLLPRLESLDIEFVLYRDDMRNPVECLQELHNCINLRELSIRKFCQQRRQGGSDGILNDRAVELIAECAWLQKLDLVMSPKITDRGLMALSQCESLSELTLWIGAKLSKVTAAGIIALAKECSQLKVLRLQMVGADAMRVMDGSAIERALAAHGRTVIVEQFQANSYGADVY